MGATTLASAPREIRRARGRGIFLLALAVATFGLFALTVGGGADATFGLNASGRGGAQLPDLVLPVRVTVIALAAVIAFLGGRQLTRGFGTRVGIVLVIGTLLFLFAFLTWAAADTRLNLVFLLRSTIVRSIPLTLGALSGVLCERAGVVNIAIEGQFLVGAFAGAIVGSAVNNVAGLLAGVLAGGVLGAILAVVTIRYLADQIIVGVVLVVFGLGITGFLNDQVLVPNTHLNAPPIFRPIDIPLLSDIPIVGPLLFDQNILVYLTFTLVAVLHVALFHTRWGLRARSVGEHPKAADTVGIDVHAVRYRNVILGGLVAGLGGAHFTVGSVGSFSKEMTGGFGFIALAAMIVGAWKPIGAFGAALVFGFAAALKDSLAILGVPIPSQFLTMAPFIATILVVAGVVGRARMPAADGQPYVKE
jgi:simple sugar transport system permease protein